MRNTPISKSVIDKAIEKFAIADFSKATIREVKAIAAEAEEASGIEFIKMEMAARLRSGPRFGAGHARREA